MADPVLRTLRAGEREDWLAFLDGWPSPSGWRGAPSDFFRRYVEGDPRFADEDVHVAERDGRLLACVQIFPRTMRLRGSAVPCGGIGTVFTDPAARHGGVASALLERAIAAMHARGMALSLLFAERHAFYGRLGWSLWPRERPLFVRGDATRLAEDGEPFDAARDLADAMALHAGYDRELDGIVLRDEIDWRRTLRCAGNPQEEFRVARAPDGALVAYARGAVLAGFYLVTELARRPEPSAAERLAELVTGMLAPRAPDPMEVPGRASAELRRVLVAPPLADPALLDALAQRGVELRRFESRDAMLQVLDVAALEQRTGERRAPGEPPDAFLRRLLPAERFFFWPADRF